MISDRRPASLDRNQRLDPVNCTVRPFLLALIGLGLCACSPGDETVPPASTATGPEDHGHSHADGAHDHSHDDGAAPDAVEGGTGGETGALFEGSRLDEAAWAHFGSGVHGNARTYRVAHVEVGGQSEVPDMPRDTYAE